MGDDKLAIPIIPPPETGYSMENETAFRREIMLLLFAIDGAFARQRDTIEEELIPEDNSRGAVILNSDFSEGSPGEGSYWATEFGSFASANSQSPTVAAGVDFISIADGETIRLWQVTSADDDITKVI